MALTEMREDRHWITSEKAVSSATKINGMDRMLERMFVCEVIVDAINKGRIGRRPWE